MTRLYFLFVLLLVVICSFFAYFQLKKYSKTQKLQRIRKKIDTLPDDKKANYLVKLYFDPERMRLQQMQMQAIQTQATGMNAGNAAGGIIKGTFNGMGSIMSMTGLPGGGIINSVMGGMGNIASNVVKDSSNALSALGRFANNVEFQDIERGVSDAELDEAMKNFIAKLPFIKKGLDSLMLDESQISELPPVCLDNYYYDGNNENLFVVRGQDGIIRTSCYQVNCLYFTAKQLCIYQYTIDLSNGINPQGSKTKEYFWKDISEFSFENLSSMGNGQKCFVIKTSGGEYYCVYKETPETNRALKGMNFYFRNIKENA